jgi:hypothetical protein
MPLAHAMWIHGNAVRVEYPDRMDATTRKGASILLEGRANSTNWFHLALPTPVFADERRLHIDSVMLRFKASGASVTAVHVYDGHEKIAAHDALNLAPNTFGLERFDVANHPEVRWGLGISFKGSFGTGGTRRIEVRSAGGDFVL